MLLLFYQRFQNKYWLIQAIFIISIYPISALAQKVPIKHSCDSHFKANTHPFFLLYENLEKMCKLKYRFYDLYQIYNEKFSLENQDKILFYKSFHFFKASKKNERNFCIQLKQQVIKPMCQDSHFDNKEKENQSNESKESFRYNTMDLKICVDHQGLIEKKIRLCASPRDLSVSLWIESQDLQEFRYYQSDHPHQTCTQNDLLSDFLKFYLPFDDQIKRVCQKKDQQIQIDYQINQEHRAQSSILGFMDQIGNQDQYPRFPLLYRSQTLDEFQGQLQMSQQKMRFEIQSKYQVLYQQQDLTFQSIALLEREEISSLLLSNQYERFFEEVQKIDALMIDVSRCQDDCLGKQDLLLKSLEKIPKIDDMIWLKLKQSPIEIKANPKLFEIHQLIQNR